MPKARHTLKLLVTGGHTGADSIAFGVSEQIGIPVGGYMAQGYAREDGRGHYFRDTFGMLEYKGSFEERDQKNISMSDGLVAFLSRTRASPGSQRVIREFTGFAVNAKPSHEGFLVIEPRATPAASFSRSTSRRDLSSAVESESHTCPALIIWDVSSVGDSASLVQAVRDFLDRFRPEHLMFVGNLEEHSPGITASGTKLLVEALSEISHPNESKQRWNAARILTNEMSLHDSLMAKTQAAEAASQRLRSGVDSYLMTPSTKSTKLECNDHIRMELNKWLQDSSTDKVPQPFVWAEEWLSKDVIAQLKQLRYPISEEAKATPAAVPSPAIPPAPPRQTHQLLADSMQLEPMAVAFQSGLVACIRKLHDELRSAEPRFQAVMGEFHEEHHWGTPGDLRDAIYNTAQRYLQSQLHAAIDVAPFTLQCTTLQPASLAAEIRNNFFEFIRDAASTADSVTTPPVPKAAPIITWATSWAEKLMGPTFTVPLHRYLSSQQLWFWDCAHGWCEASVTSSPIHPEGSTHEIQLIQCPSGAPPPASFITELSWYNHAPRQSTLNDFTMALERYCIQKFERHKYIVDALSGKKLDVLKQLIPIAIVKASEASGGEKTNKRGGDRLGQFSACRNVIDLSRQLQDSYEQRLRGRVSSLSPLLLTAPPAGGKSCLTGQLMLKILQDGREQPGTGLIPVLIRLIDLSHLFGRQECRDAFFQSWNWVDAYLQLTQGVTSQCYQMLRAALMCRRALIILDGIDEGGAHKQDIERHIQEVLQPQGHVMIVTSRPEGEATSLTTRHHGIHLIRLNSLAVRDFPQVSGR